MLIAVVSGAKALGAGRVIWISTPKYPINTIALIIGSKKGGSTKSAPQASRNAFFRTEVDTCILFRLLFVLAHSEDTGGDCTGRR